MATFKDVATGLIGCPCPICGQPGKPVGKPTIDGDYIEIEFDCPDKKCKQHGKKWKFRWRWTW